MRPGYTWLTSQSWPLGIQDVKEKEPQCLQMKLRGRPWFTSDGAEVNYSRLLSCSILSAMDANGFELVGSIDMSAYNSTNDSKGDCRWIPCSTMRAH